MNKIANIIIYYILYVLIILTYYIYTSLLKSIILSKEKFGTFVFIFETFELY